MNDHATPPPSPHRAPRARRKPTKPLSLKPIVLLVAVAILAAGGVLVYDTIRDPQAAALKQDANLDVLVVPEFAMTTQSGEPFTRDDLLGHITVMDFFFTNCPAICPALSRSMKNIQDAVGDKGVRLVSVSVDPKNDTEAILRAHAQELGADPAVWTFLRADDFEQVRVLSEDGLKLGLSLDDSRQIKTRLGDDMPWIDHSGKLLLLDSEARVIGLYSGLDERDVARLIERLTRATTPK
jgi:protein SCO1/2